MTEGEAEVELVGAGGAYGLFDVNEPARWSALEIKLGDIITTAVPGELLGADGVEGIFLVTGIELGADGSALVRVKSVGSSHPEASFFNRKEGHLHVCASAGFCGEEGGVFHVQRLELWDGLTFPTHRLSPAGKRMVKQFEAGEELDEVREPLEGAAGRPSALRKKPSGEPKEAQLRGKGQGDRRDRPKGHQEVGKSEATWSRWHGCRDAQGQVGPGQEASTKLGTWTRSSDRWRPLGCRGGWRCRPCSGRIGHIYEVGTPEGGSWPSPCCPDQWRRPWGGAKRRYFEALEDDEQEVECGLLSGATSSQDLQVEGWKEKEEEEAKGSGEALQTIFGGGKKKKKKKKKRKREGGDPSGSSPSSDEGDSYSSGEDVDSSETDKEDLLPPLKKRSERMEGSALSLLIERIEARLNELSGAGESSDPVLTGTKVVTSGTP